MIKCYDAYSGEFNWSFQTGSTIYSSPAIANNKVVIGSGDHSIYCLNLTTGEQVWNFTTNGIVDSSPALAYSKVFIGSDDGNLYCFGSEEEPEHPVPFALLVNPQNLEEVSAENSELEINGYAETEVGDIEYVEVSLDSGPWMKANGTSNWSLRINISGLTNGSHSISNRAFNGIKYSGDQSIQFIVFHPDNNDTPNGTNENGNNTDPGSDILYLVIIGIIIVIFCLILAVIIVSKKHSKEL